MKRRDFHFLVLAAAALHPVFAVEKIDPDPKGVALVTSLLQALAEPDPSKRLQAVLPLVHKSMLSPDGRDLDRNVKDFSYKKASGAVGFYTVPADVTEVHKGNVTTVGFKDTAETGRTDKYFVAKKPGVNGRPAPIHVFWPADGGEPKILNMGSL